MILLYGAYGYTGKLICEEAEKLGVPLILAGRSAEKLRSLPQASEWEVRPFSLEDSAEIDRNLQGVSLVLHAAGPFIETSGPMLEACLRNKVHYTDITGEIKVFELAHAQDGRAKEAGIVVMPGTGFDVVPTDCLALFLSKLLPDATDLKLAFSAMGGGVSRGTALTMIYILGESSAIRKNGRITRVPLGHRTLKAPFHGSTRFCMTIPWGDVSTAYYTTGIPNIETYMGIHPKSYRWVKLQRRLGWLLRKNWVRGIIRNRIRRGPAGPPENKREKGQSLVWGRVTNDKGEKREARLRTQDGYSLTAKTALEIALRITKGSLQPGFHTPAGAFGADFIMEFPGSQREEIQLSK